MKNSLTSVLLSLLSGLILSYKSAAQLPTCPTDVGYVYLHAGNNIYNWDPLKPISSANPSLNTIIISGNGLAISRNLNASGPSPTFYTVLNGLFYYYNGTGWVNTGHTVPRTAVNIGGGGGYIYAVESPGGEIWKYDGSGNATFLMTIPGFSSSVGALDIVADIFGNFYVLRTLNPEQWLRKYDPNGNLLKEWKLVGAPSFGPSGALAIICDRLYYYDNGPKYGIIGDTTVNVSPIQGYLPLAGDFANCEIGEGTLSGGGDTTISVVRGCRSAFVNFHRDKADATPYSFKLRINGTAANGYDYRHIDSIFYIPANQKDALLEVKPLLISNLTGTKEAIIQVWGQSCMAGGTEGILRTITVKIQDSLQANIITPPDTICAGTEITIQAVIDSGLDFKWEPEALIPDPRSLTIHPKVDTTTVFSITVSQKDAPPTCPPRTLQYRVTVESYPQLNIPADTTLCLPDSIDLILFAQAQDAGYSYNWAPASFLRDNFSAHNKFYAPVGKYKKVITMTSSSGCQSKDSFIINVIPLFSFEEITQDTTIQYGDTIMLISESQAISWLWKPGKYLKDPAAASTYAWPRENMVYTLTGYDKYGCSNTATVRVNITYHPDIFVPTAFSPNGDGTNDLFKLENVRFEQLVFLRIFNRWGQLIFETIGSQKGWDGTYKNIPADAGTYFFTARLTDPFGKQIDLKGDIILIR